MISRLANGSVRVVIPGMSGFHRKIPGAPFHATAEFFWQIGGATDFRCPAGNFRLRTGEVCIMPAGVPHGETPVDLRTRYGVVVVVRAGGGFITMRGDVDHLRRIQSRDLVGYSRGGQAFQHLDLAALAPAIDRTLRKAYVAGLATAFLARILTEIRNPSRSLGKPIPPVVREAEKVVRVEISNANLTVNGIASRLGISPDHLTRLFKTTHGMSLSVWIAKERVQLACDLLARPEHNIAEVGWTCGFASTSYFIRVFRAHTATTPKAWRMRAAANP